MLLKQLQKEMKEAMKSGDKEKLSVIRMLISEIKKVQIDSKKELTDQDIIKILQKYAKQRKEAIQQYKKANRPDLAEKEQKELEIVQQYLPQSLSREELEKIIDETISELGASSMKDMGKVMKAVTEKVQGRAEGSVISQIVREKLSK